MDFLNNRKYKVIANGVMLEEQDVITGIPQEKFLALLFFIIMMQK